MDQRTLQHVQIFNSVLLGFAKPDANAVQYLDLATGEIRHKEIKLMEGRAQYHHRDMEAYLEEQQSRPVAELLAYCRDIQAGAKRIPFTQDAICSLRMFLRYLLKRVEGICFASEQREVPTEFKPQVLSSVHMLNMPVSQDSNEEYYPVLFHNTSGTDLILPYTCAFTTHAIFDSICYALPVSPQCLLMFMHTTLHKYFYDGESLSVQTIQDEAVVKCINNDALQAELQSGARYVVGSASELRRVQRILEQRLHRNGSAEVKIG